QTRRTHRGARSPLRAGGDAEHPQRHRRAHGARPRENLTIRQRLTVRLPLPQNRLARNRISALQAIPLEGPMPTTAEIAIRLARPTDAADVARLHADSWRRHYRGAYSDYYLDGDVDADRLAVWTERINDDRGAHFTLLAEHAERAVGFIHVVLDADGTWGALVDNLHVTHSVQRSGIGTLLLDRAARTVVARRPGSGIYLWVLEQNEPAQAFYVSRG